MRDTLFSLSRNKITFKEYSNFPPVLRDLSIIVDSNVKEGEVEKVIWSAPADNLLKKVRLYDVFGISSNIKSYTYTLEFRADDRTLTNDEVNKLQDKIITDLSSKLKAELRS
jgi:phenylalanyl-tRNA synthetase beta chain